MVGHAKQLNLVARPWHGAMCAASFPTSLPLNPILRNKPFTERIDSRDLETKMRPWASETANRAPTFHKCQKIIVDTVAAQAILNFER
jgi:hypothetical protein